jgi:hypothetical protein
MLRHSSLAVLLGLLGAVGAARAADLIEFWDEPRHGANSFNATPPDAGYFEALRGHGATWVRLAFGKWPGTRRDFLAGSLDDYRKLDAADLATLRGALDRAHAAGLKIVVTPLSLPGARWKQQNDDRFDDRLWSEERYWQDAARYWRDLAEALADHPAVAAYNLVNEPAPERKGGLDDDASAAEAAAWYEKQRGTSRDLSRLYLMLIAAIREVDPLTPVMVDAGNYASAAAFTHWPAKLPDERVLYSFHMYEPWVATSGPNLKRAQPLGYPAAIPGDKGEVFWDAARVADWLAQPFAWAKSRGIPPSRLVAGEFGCMRRWKPCPRYLEDVLTVLDRERAHWAFYAFREDAWDGMDYELGDKPLPAAYWSAIERGDTPTLARGRSPVFEPIRKRLAR